MASIVIRSVIIYALLTVFLRIMGKRQIGELDVSELVSTLLISELAAIPIDDPDIPLLNAIIPSLIILSAEILLSTLKNKSEKLKKIFEGTASYIIYKGRLLQSALTENRISINEVISEMHREGIGDISEIEYAIIEPSGNISFIKQGEAVAHAVIIDGNIIEKCIKRLGRTRGWVEKEVSKRGYRISEVFLMTVDDDGGINLIKKDGKGR